MECSLLQHEYDFRAQLKRWVPSTRVYVTLLPSANTREVLTRVLLEPGNLNCKSFLCLLYLAQDTNTSQCKALINIIR